jgi:hypothetical protein
MKASYSMLASLLLFLTSCSPPPTLDNVSEVASPVTMPPSEDITASGDESCPPYTIETNLNGFVNLTGTEVDNAIQSIRSDSPLIGLGQTIVEVSKREGINPFYIVAHAAWESTWGTSRIANDKNNLFGYGAYNSCPYECAWTFKSKAESIETVMPIIKANYLTEGGKYYNGPTLTGMNIKYATDQNWKNGIASIMNSLAVKIPSLCISTSSPVPIPTFTPAPLMPSIKPSPTPVILQGSWEGPVNQPGTPYYTTTLTLTGCSTPNTVCGSVEYPELSCGGIITFRYEENGVYYLHESIRYGTDRCVNEVDIDLEQISGSSWKATYRADGIGDFETTLTKTD